MARAWRLRAKVPVAAVWALACVLGTGARAAGNAAGEGASPAREPAEAGATVAQAAAKKKSDPLESQRAVDNAAKLLEAGKAEQAVQVLSTTLAAGNLPPAVMAKALFYRGVAYRQQKKPAQAISDFTSALWLKGGLSESDRAEGLRQRAAAYQEAGLSQSGDASPPALARDARSKERSAPAAPPWGDATTTATPASALNQEQAKEPASGGGWDLFGSLFGGGNAFAGASAAPSPAPAADANQILNGEASTAERAPPPRRAQASAWSRQTQVEAERGPRVETDRGPRVETAAIAPKSDGAKPQTAPSEPPKSGAHLRIQIGAVRTQAEAKALAAKVVREHAATLASREPQIDQTVMGNMGSFYRVLIGPFASAQETQSVCAKLKGSGLDCLVTAQ